MAANRGVYAAGFERVTIAECNMAIDRERLQRIPKEFQEQHSFCFWLHDMMVDVMRQAEAARVTHVNIRFKDGDEAERFAAADDPITFCLDNGRDDDAKRILMNHVVIPLYSDLLHFVYEGLKALEKRKYVVAFSLFRKPFKYSLMFVTWIFADEDDFFERLRKAPAELLRDGDKNLSKERRLELLGKAVSSLPNNEFLTAEGIYGMVYDKKNVRSLAPYFDMAAHLVTSHAGIETKALNLNFIFKSPNDTDVYAGIYFPLAYLLMYLLLLEIATIGRMASVPESYKKWIITATLGTCEALFGDGATNLLDAVNRTWVELFTCSLCGIALHLTAENALRFFATEHIDCTNCGAKQQFPLFWIMSKFSNGDPNESEKTQA